MAQILENSNEGRYQLYYFRVPHDFIKEPGQIEKIDQDPSLLLLDTRLGIVYELEVNYSKTIENDSTEVVFHYQISELFDINEGSRFDIFRTANK